MTIDFSGQTVVVTGAGNGLGKASAIYLAELGASVVCNDLGGNPDGTGGGPDAADQTVAEITTAGGIAVASYANVATASGGAAVIEHAVEAFGRLDAVAHYAAIVRTQAFAELPAEDFEAVVINNLFGTFYVSQPAYRHMRDNGGGRILFVGSAVGLVGIQRESNYAASKGGVYGLMRCVALEGAAHGVVANYLMPAAQTRMAVHGPLHDNPQVRRIRERGGLAGDPRYGAALAAVLLSTDCPTSGQAFGAMAGAFDTAYVTVTKGWRPTFTDRMPTADDVVEHWSDVASRAEVTEPEKMRDWAVHLNDELKAFTW